MQLGHLAEGMRRFVASLQLRAPGNAQPYQPRAVIPLAQREQAQAHVKIEWPVRRHSCVPTDCVLELTR